MLWMFHCLDWSGKIRATTTINATSSCCTNGPPIIIKFSWYEVKMDSYFFFCFVYLLLLFLQFLLPDCFSRFVCFSAPSPDQNARFSELWKTRNLSVSFVWVLVWLVVIFSLLGQIFPSRLISAHRPLRHIVFPSFPIGTNPWQQSVTQPPFSCRPHPHAARLFLLPTWWHPQ